jgi:hypothetical protein
MNPMDTNRECLLNGCQFHMANQQLTHASATLRQAEEIYAKAVHAMSAALWCDLGNHAFSAREKGITSYSIETAETDEKTGEEKLVKQTLTACANHAAQRRAAFQPAAALSSAEAIGADRQLYTEFLEWKNGLRDTPPVTEP